MVLVLSSLSLVHPSFLINPSNSGEFVLLFIKPCLSLSTALHRSISHSIPRVAQCVELRGWDIVEWDIVELQHRWKVIRRAQFVSESSPRAPELNSKFVC